MIVLNCLSIFVDFEFMLMLCMYVILKNKYCIYENLKWYLIKECSFNIVKLFVIFVKKYIMK